MSHTHGITRLGLQNFRSYDALSLSITAKHVIITGQNGIGKTNLLEAISLFSVGRGLRGTAPHEWRKTGTYDTWGISITLEDDTTLITRGGSSDGKQQRRQFLFQNAPLSSQADLAEYVAVVWLTPQMDGLFLDEAAARRKFFDRLIYAVHPQHAQHLQRYEQALRQRNRNLKERASDALIRAWNPVLVAEGVALAAARLEKTAQLNDAFTTMNTPFPLPELKWIGAIEDYLQNNSALATEDFFHAQLEAQLEHDRITGQTRIGVHRSDVETWHRTKNIPVSQCSTGEQKALLLSLVLAHADWLKSIVPERPLLLLLDDVAAHLDANRQQQLFEWAMSLPAQLWLTGAEEGPFSALSENVQHIKLPI